MATPTVRESRFVPTERLLPPVPTARALMFAGIAALLGAVAWGLIAFYAHYEVGYLAWGIGALVGFAAIKGGGHGTLVAVAAGALALLSIGTGKQLAFRMSMDQAAQEYVDEHVTTAVHAERERDAADWVALGDAPTADQVQAYVEGHGFDADDMTQFAAEEGPELRRFAAENLTLEQWRDQVRERFVSGFSFVEYLQDDFHPADILFVLLGIASAFGLVSNHTTKLHVAVREAERKRREAEAQATQTPAPD